MLSASLAIVVAASAALRSAAAATLQASPGGSGTACSSASPCALADALSSAEANDDISLAGGTYTGNFVIATPGLTVQPAGAATATIVSAETPNEAGLNVALTIAATGVTVTGITVTHGPNSEAPDPAFRDVGIFVTPTSGGVVLSGVTIARAEGRAFEPATGPGSRGLLVFDTADVTLQDSTITGAYEDAVHLPARDTKIMNNEISGATRIAIACIQETPDSDNSGHVFSGNSIVGFGLDGIQVQCDDVTVTDNMIDPGTVVNAQQARAQFVSTRSERRESGERRETPPMAPDSTAVYGIHVCGPTNFDEDGDQAICVAPLRPVCAPGPIAAVLTPCIGNRFPTNTAAECSSERGTECRVKNQFYGACWPADRPTPEDWEGSRAQCRRDVAENVSLSGNVFMGDTLKQDIVQP